MGPTSVEDDAPDARRKARSSLYLAATLYCDGAATPVKIRNLSSNGALIEGPISATVGSLIQLVRGGLIVHGLIAWSSGGRSGLKFSGSVDVSKWRALPGNVEQNRVDEIVKLVKAGAVPLPVPSLTAAHEPGRFLDPGAELSTDLGRALELLDAMGDVLAADEDTVTRTEAALQNLDIAMQIIRAVKSIIADENDLEIDPAKLHGLRRSAEQALLKHV